MKNRVKIANITLLVALYCYLLVLVPTLIEPTFAGNDTRSKQSQYSADLSQKLFCQTTATENILIECASKPTSFIKNPFTENKCTEVRRERALASAITHYTTYSQHLLINHRKGDHIFPFHYYW